MISALVGAGHVLDAAQHVGLDGLPDRTQRLEAGIASVGGAVAERDDIRLAVGGDRPSWLRKLAVSVPPFADDDVVAEPAVDDVAAAAPVEHVGQLVAGDGLAVVGPGHVLDADQDVGLDHTEHPRQRARLRQRERPGGR